MLTGISVSNMQWTNFVRNLLTPGNEAKVLPDFGEVIEKMSEQGKREAGLKKVLKGIGIMVLVLIAINYIRDSGVMDQVMEKHLAVDDSMSIKNTIGRLSNEELAWHAVNTYQWDCDEVVSRGKMSNAEFYPITCSNGKMLRVYPRQNTHPKITNKSGSSRQLQSWSSNIAEDGQNPRIVSEHLWSSEQIIGLQMADGSG